MVGHETEHILRTLIHKGHQTDLCGGCLKVKSVEHASNSTDDQNICDKIRTTACTHVLLLLFDFFKHLLSRFASKHIY